MRTNTHNPHFISNRDKALLPFLPPLLPPPLLSPLLLPFSFPSSSSPSFPHYPSLPPSSNSHLSLLPSFLYSSSLLTPSLHHPPLSCLLSFFCSYPSLLPPSSPSLFLTHSMRLHHQFWKFLHTLRITPSRHNFFFCLLFLLCGSDNPVGHGDFFRSALRRHSPLLRFWNRTRRRDLSICWISIHTSTQ